jgi:hypothetical protein
VEVWARLITSRVGSWRPELRAADLDGLRDPTARSVRAALDLFLGWSLIDRIGGLAPELAAVLLVYLQLALYRAIMAAFDLLVVRDVDFRPGILVLRRATHALARRTLRWVTIYLIARFFIRRLLWDVLSLDRVDILAARGFDLVFLGMVGLALYRWAPLLRARMQMRNQESPLVAWLARGDGGRLVAVLRAAGSTVFLGVVAVAELGYFVVRSRSGFNWLLNAVNRLRITDEDDPARPTLSSEQVAALSQVDTPEASLVEREGWKDMLLAEWSRWQREHRQGMVALLGDRGGGKRTALDNGARWLKAEGAQVERASVEHRLTTESQARDWLAKVAGVEPGGTLDELVERVEGLPPTVFVLEHLHRAFARRVDGFGAFNALLYVLNATSDRHFWLVSMHEPAWFFLASLGSVVDVGVFRAVHHLAPLNLDELRTLLVARAERVGLQPDFAGLVRSGTLGADRSVELERAERSFFRLLSEAADNNLRVALHLWSGALEPVGDEGVVRVHTSAALGGGVLSSLADNALFVLVALRIQDELDGDELAAVTNLPMATLRRTIRDLRARGLLEVRPRGVRIPDALQPKVTRTLRRRHFYYFGR